MNYQNIVFIDIETIPQKRSYSKLPEVVQRLWDKKARVINRGENTTPEKTYERAGIYSEFGKIISIAIGYFTGKNNALRIRDFSGHDEQKLLTDFKKFIERKFKNKDIQLCAHNGKEFDFPYIARRMIINRISLPDVLKLSGKKPWEVPHLDTMEMWKFGDYKHFTSLDLLASVLGIPSSKSDIDGSNIYDVYYHQKDLDRISDYCKRDVAVLAQVYLRLQGQTSIPERNIVFLKK